MFYGIVAGQDYLALVYPNMWHIFMVDKAGWHPLEF